MDSDARNICLIMVLLSLVSGIIFAFFAQGIVSTILFSTAIISLVIFVAGEEITGAINKIKP